MLFRNRKTRPDKYTLSLGGIPVEVTRKNIRHLYLRVCPRTGTVRISAPRGAGRDRVSEFARQRAEWIKKHRSKRPERARPPLKYVTGETHYFRGRAFVLEAEDHDGPPEVSLRGGYLNLKVRKGSGIEKRKQVMDGWYRERLKEKIPPLIGKWEKKAGVKVNEWRIRKMKTRWGTCSVNKRRIWFNLELMKKPAECLEYIVVHEITHLLEPRHDKRYRALMDGFMPGWRERKKELDNFPG